MLRRLYQPDERFKYLVVFSFVLFLISFISFFSEGVSPLACLNVCLKCG